MNAARKTGSSAKVAATWRTVHLSLSALWGRPLPHQVDPRQGPQVCLRLEYLAELHRRRALVPLPHVAWRQSQATAANGYSQHRSAMASVIVSAMQQGLAQA